LKQVIIHTDGACSGNPGPGGWAAILRHDVHCREVSGGDPATTNNRMELQAALGALAALKEPCRIEFFTDSEYLRQGITEWISQWKRRGWLTRDRKPVKNVDLWQSLDQLVAPHQIDWKWLKGHAGHADNERCDVLARQAIDGIRQQHSSAQLKALKAAFEDRRDPVSTQVKLI